MSIEPETIELQSSSPQILPPQSQVPLSRLSSSVPLSRSSSVSSVSNNPNPDSFFGNLVPVDDEEENTEIKATSQLEEAIKTMIDETTTQLQQEARAAPAPAPEAENVVILRKKLTSLTIMQSLTMDENLENYLLFQEFFTDADLQTLENVFDDYGPNTYPKMKMRTILSMLVLYAKYYKNNTKLPYLLRDESYITLVDDIRATFLSYSSINAQMTSKNIKSDFYKFFTKNKKTKKILENLINGTLMIEVYKNLLKPKLERADYPVLTDEEIIDNIRLLLENSNMFLLPFIQIFKEPFTPQTIAVRQSLEDVCTSLGKTYNTMDLNDPPLLFPRVLPEDSSVYRGGFTSKNKRKQRNSKKIHKNQNKQPKKTYKKTINKVKRRNTIKLSRPLQKGRKTIRKHHKTI